MTNKKLIIGIQGGAGSFNEEALLANINRYTQKYVIKYLYTSDKVLSELNNGKINLGQFAVINSLSGVVNESVQAMGKYNFKIIDKYSIKIVQNLLIHKNSNIDTIKSVMTHPQSLAQCAKNLAKKYPHIKQAVGKGNYIDHAFVAKMISKGKLSSSIATIGSKTLANLYNLKVQESNLQDSNSNITTFLLVQGRVKYN